MCLVKWRSIFRLLLVWSNQKQIMFQLSYSLQWLYYSKPAKFIGSESPPPTKTHLDILQHAKPKLHGPGRSVRLDMGYLKSQTWVLLSFANFLHYNEVSNPYPLSDFRTRVLQDNVKSPCNIVQDWNWIQYSTSLQQTGNSIDMRDKIVVIIEVT